jgi:hypothetical protein
VPQVSINSWTSDGREVLVHQPRCPFLKSTLEEEFCDSPGNVSDNCLRAARCAFPCVFFTPLVLAHAIVYGTVVIASLNPCHHSKEGLARTKLNGHRLQSSRALT